jgi:hypothetical protein
MQDIYIIEYIDRSTQKEVRSIVALVHDRAEVDIFMCGVEWHKDPWGSSQYVISFEVNHYKRDEIGVMTKVKTLDFSHLKPLAYSSSGFST